MEVELEKITKLLEDIIQTLKTEIQNIEKINNTYTKTKVTQDVFGKLVNSIIPNISKNIEETFNNYFKRSGNQLDQAKKEIIENLKKNISLNLINLKNKLSKLDYSNIKETYDNLIEYISILNRL